MPGKSIINTIPPAVQGGPLMCWDIVMEGYHRMMQLMNDAEKLNRLAFARNWNHDWNFADKLLMESKVIVVTSPQTEIEFATENILHMTGYTASEVTGKTPRMFQGKATSADIRSIIRMAVLDKKPFKETLVNYRKNGDMYHCLIEGFPLFNRKGRLVNFIAFEQEAA